MAGIYNQGFIFCDKVKEKLCSDDYRAFLKCLHIYSNGIIKRNDLQNLVCPICLWQLFEPFNLMLDYLFIFKGPLQAYVSPLAFAS